ncbi:low molecular weight phosphatase family protein [Agrococcus terreus]
MPYPRAGSRAPGQPFTVLMVCTGNICRSPLAEHLLRARLPRAFGADTLPDVQIASSGTRAVVGAPLEPEARIELERLGAADHAQHRARQLEPDHVRESDLVLGLEREHRGAALVLEPVASRRAFTLREFARIVGAMADGRLTHDVAPLDSRGVARFMDDVVAAAARGRGLLPPPDAPEELDIPDPYRRGARAHRASADASSAAVDALVDALRALAAA